MIELKKGSRGPEVARLQVRLNIRLTPSPKLHPDGIFGPKTEAAVIRFQQGNGLLPPKGVVDGKTWGTLTAVPPMPPPPNLAKFVAELGTLDDFVSYVAQLEATSPSRSVVMDKLADVYGTATQKRYLLVKMDRTGVIDFRHFFAAASESYNSGKSRLAGMRLGGSPGQAVLLGLGNELAQCACEAVARKFNSCFSSEDLGSNRLGAQFGELVKVRESEASRQPIHQLLQQYLSVAGPLPPDQVNTIRTPGRWDIAVEALTAVFAGIHDLVFPRAY